MDIAKYIGLYLHKNQFCAIPGLGQLRVIKGGTYFKDDVLYPGEYAIELSTIGAIDDGFPNFIANAEMVSISKSSNEISQFVAEAKERLREGEDIVIPTVGKFFMRNGVLGFETDANMQITPPAIPVVKIAEPRLDVKVPYEQLRPEDYQQNAEVESASINWSKLLITLALLAVVIVGGILAFNYMNKPSGTSETRTVDTLQQDEPMPMEQADTGLSTSPVISDTAIVPAKAGGGEAIINEYSNVESAERRAAKLKSFGRENVRVVQRDSVWFVVLPVEDVNNKQVLDSLARLYNPKGVRALP